MGKLVFVVSQRRHHTFFQHIALRKIFPFFFFFLNAYFSDDETQTPPAYDNEPADRGPGNLYARLFFSSVLPSYLSRAIPLELIRDLVRLQCTHVLPLLTFFTCNKRQNFP